MDPQSSPFRTPWWHLYVPKSVTVLRAGYKLADLRADVIAGLTVAIVALPLSMALGIASGASPANGLITAVVAGFVISLLSGCRVQIGGPAGAFVVVVFNIIAAHGYDGLVIATLMAGAMLVVAGFLRLGDWIKYIPQPVITGFTAGIALIIFSSQIRDLFGLPIDTVPGDFLAKWALFWEMRDGVRWESVALSFGALALIILLRRFAPRMPAFLLAVGAASLAVWVFKIEAPTVGSAFGGIPDTLPMPHWPEVSAERVRELLPSAFTIAFLAGIESLLCAVVADGMTGRRHKSNCELVGQGVANCVSALFGGMPATGTIARTATNIRAGGRTPVAGMVHAAFILLFMMMFAPLASYIPLASLAAVLVVVAWNMSEREKIAALLRGPRGDGLVLVITFLLTVLVDLTVAIEVGVVMAAILFMHRMAQPFATDSGEEEGEDMRARLPAGAEVFQLQGPLFFGVAGRLIDALEQVRTPPKVFILRMRLVPMIDASGVVALEEFIRRCHKHDTVVILSGVQAQLRRVIDGMDIVHKAGDVTFAADFNEAIQVAEKIIQKQGR